MKKIIALCLMPLLLFLAISSILVSNVKAEGGSSSNSSYKLLHVSVFKQNELQKIIDSVGASALFTITQVSVDEFNKGNPSDLSVYNAIVFGINDWGEVAGDRSRKYGRLAELENYVSNGGGIIWTHDTLEQWWDYGSQIEEPAGVDNYDISDKNRERVWYSWVKIVEDHTILHQPYEIGNVGDTIGVQYTHTNGGRVKTAKAIIKSYNGKYESQATDANDFYLTINEYGKGRVAILEIGHSTIREDKPSVINIPSDKESKILVNTLCWVSSAEVVISKPLQISLISPLNGILVFSFTYNDGETQKTWNPQLIAKVTQDGKPKEGIQVKFFIDEKEVGSSISDTQGIVKVTYNNPIEGHHKWYTIAQSSKSEIWEFDFKKPQEPKPEELIIDFIGRWKLDTVEWASLGIAKYYSKGWSSSSDQYSPITPAKIGGSKPDITLLTDSVYIAYFSVNKITPGFGSSRTLVICIPKTFEIYDYASSKWLSINNVERNGP